MMMFTMSVRTEREGKGQKVRTGLTHRLRDNQGASILELVFLLPLLVIMAFGVIDLGRLIHARLVVTNVSREGGSLASRARGGPNLIAMLQSSATPFDLVNQGQIYITEIGAEDPTHAPPIVNPYIISRSQNGSLSVSSSISGAVQGQLQSGLSQTMVDHLRVILPATTADISGVTVVEVFYHYRPITPLPQFVQNLFPYSGGIIIGSKSVFQRG
jgi:hypothetical protein